MSTAHRFRGAFFTDLDGTLLDRKSFKPSASAMAALRAMRDHGLAVVPVSSKTAAELELYPEIAALGELALMEGGAVVVRKGHAPEVRGPGKATMAEVLGELKAKGYPVRGISGMSDAELCRLTGLPEDRARFARDRLAGDPFTIDREPGPWLDDLQRHARSLGAEVARGGTLWHLLPPGNDKGAAVRRILDSEPGFHGVPSAAVGDAWNDLAMLVEVDQGYLLGITVADAELPEGVCRVKDEGPGGLVIAAEAFLKCCLGKNC